MIFVDRAAVPPPQILSTQGRMEFERAHEFYAVEEKDRRQRRFDFTTYRHSEVRAALTHLFHAKCAYCESKVLHVAALDIEHFRPKGGVVRPDGTLLPDHYWWLTVTWENLYLACESCNRMHRSSAITTITKAVASSSTAGSDFTIVGKGDRFPLEDETTRASLEAGPEELARENPLLLDPCRDEPSEHLVFLDDGTVVSDTPRGQATIEILGLNRKPLVEARHEATLEAQTLFDLTRSLKHSSPRRKRALAQIAGLANPEQEYAGLKRQLVGAYERSYGAPLSAERATEQVVVVSASKVRRAKASHRRYLTEQESFSLADKKQLERYRSVRRHVERIVVENVKAIQSVDLDLREASSSTAPWTMLLGENGTGKSTILQAVALALIGEKYAQKLGLDPEDFIRRAPRVKSGSVEVYLTGSRTSRKVVIRPGGFEFIRSDAPQTLVLGYGGTRLLPASGAPPAMSSQWARVESLFRPTTSLTDADTWLIGTDESAFGYTAGVIQHLLGLPRDREWLDRSEGVVVVREHGREMRLKALSTGYQSVLATVIDILELTFSLWPTPESAEGIVLLDEIDTHLHPTWKMRIVGRLRQMMPSMQFIVTTHEPLCLRGLDDGEVVLMKRDAKDRAYAVTDLPPPRELRVDQLLTSRHFGLSSTLDPDLDERFDEYYQLLSYDDGDLTKEQRDRRDTLRRDLQGHGVLGYTRRDQLVYEAIDGFLAAERKERERRGPGPDASDLETRRQETLHRVADLWRYAVAADTLERPAGEGQPGAGP